MHTATHRRPPIRWTPRAYRLGRIAHELATIVGIGVSLGVVVLAAWIAS